MVIAKSPQHDSTCATNTIKETDPKKDPMTESSIGHKRQADEHADTPEKKRAKVTHGDAVATNARKREKTEDNRDKR